MPTNLDGSNNEATKEYIASKMQRQFWFINEMNPANSAYNIISLFEIEGSLKFDALEFAVEQVSIQFDSLRTTLFERDGAIWQRIHPPSSFRYFHLVDLSNKSEQLEERIRKESTCAFDLRTGPLLKVYCFKISPKQSSLLIVMHHAIVDLYSKQIFSRCLEYWYQHFGKANHSQIVNFSPSYSDFSERQQHWLKSSKAEKQALFWKNTLSHHSMMLNLPTDYSRSEHTNLKGKAAFFKFSLEETLVLKNLAVAENTHIFIIMLAAYCVLLNKYTKQKEFIIGVPLTNRRNTEDVDIFGCCVNIVPLPVRYEKAIPFGELVRRIRRQMLLAHRNQELPFESILHYVKPIHRVGVNPIIQTGFTFDHLMDLKLDGLIVSSKKVHNEGAQLDLFLTVWKTEPQLEGLFEYDASLFSEVTIQNLTDCFKDIIGRVSETFDISVDDLSQLTEKEINLITTVCNPPTVTVPQRIGVHQLFETQAKLNPNSIAVQYDSKKITYEKLNRDADYLATYLVNLGISHNSIVGIHLNRGTKFLVAMLAILKAGGAYLPLDPSYPIERLRYIVEDSGICLLIEQPNQSLGIDNPNITVLNPDNLQTCSDQIPTFCTQDNIEYNNPAYILYTSGSTGKPKGIAVPHSAVVKMKKRPGMVADDVILSVTTPAFDISVLEYFLPLSVGAQIILTNQDDVQKADVLISIIKNQRPTMMQATPSTWQLLCAAGLEGPMNLKILCGGESLTDSLAAKLCEISDDVWNMYGPTETTVWSTCGKVEKGKPVSIGYPIDNTQIYIVDSEMNLCPPGVSGELLIGGAGLCIGYVNRPELNKEKFIADPFSGNPKNRLYRTGDIAKLLADGTLIHLGRMDSQIKLRGFRVELGEIENVLANHPDIFRCAVIAHDKSETDRRLVAYIQTHDGSPISSNELQNFLKTRLTDYMIPSSFQYLTKLPMTDNNKIARNQLPEPVYDLPATASVHAPILRESEQKVAICWSKALGVSNVGQNDNFFDIGGNSLIAIETVSLISKAFGISLPIAQFFQFPTVSALASFIDTSNVDKDSKKIEDRIAKRKAALLKRSR